MLIRTSIFSGRKTRQAAGSRRCSRFAISTVDRVRRSHRLTDGFEEITSEKSETRETAKISSWMGREEVESDGSFSILSATATALVVSLFFVTAIIRT